MNDQYLIRALLHLHSFPTRRSSDLLRAEPELELDRLDALLGGPPPRLGFGQGGAAPSACQRQVDRGARLPHRLDRKSTRLNSSHSQISYAVFCLKKKKITSRNFPCL